MYCSFLSLLVLAGLQKGPKNVNEDEMDSRRLRTDCLWEGETGLAFSCPLARIYLESVWDMQTLQNARHPCFLHL